MIIQCIDLSLYIWHLKSGHLDRIVSGSSAGDILKCTDCKLE
jgi:hypothetical protein